MAKKNKEVVVEEVVEVLPRYVASIQDKKDETCYKDFYESDRLDQVKAKAEQESKEAGRSVIVFDRKGLGIIERYVVEKAELKVFNPAEKKQKPIKRGR
jgi:hypothetical protein